MSGATLSNLRTQLIPALLKSDLDATIGISIYLSPHRCVLAFFDRGVDRHLPLPGLDVRRWRRLKGKR